MSMHVKPGRMLSTPNVETLRLQFMAAQYMKRMGERIATAREAKGWSQGQLARAVEKVRRRDDPDAANIDSSSISRYEKGKVEPSAAMKGYLAEALGVPVSHFLVVQGEKAQAPVVVTQLDRIERKLDCLLEYFELDPDAERRKTFTDAFRSMAPDRPPR